MKELLKELCLADGVSGDESAVRELIISKIKDVCEYSVDNLGSMPEYGNISGCFSLGLKGEGLVADFGKSEVRHGCKLFGSINGVLPLVKLFVLFRDNRAFLTGEAVHNCGNALLLGFFLLFAVGAGWQEIQLGSAIIVKEPFTEKLLEIACISFFS